MVAKYPILDDYVNAWPFDILLGRHLKYSCEKHKDETVEEKTVTTIRRRA